MKKLLTKLSEVVDYTLYRLRVMLYTATLLPDEEHLLFTDEDWTIITKAVDEMKKQRCKVIDINLSVGPRVLSL